MSARILSKDEIIERVKDQSIKISYYCLKYGGDPGDYEVSHNPELGNHDDQQSDAWKLFMKSLDPDCLRLTVGPFAMVEQRSILRILLDNIPVFFKRPFESREGQSIFNISENGPLIFYPGENVVVGTNEDIAVNNRIGASLYATVRNTDIGLPHISTTIDPGWKGRLQIGLVNPTRTKKRFQFMEQICKVRFHEFDRDCPDGEIKPQSLSWRAVIEDKSKPYFPSRNDQRNNWQSWQSKKKYIKEIVMSIFLIPGSIFGVLGFEWYLNEKYHEIKDHYDEQYDDIKDHYDGQLKDQNHKIDVLSERLDIKRLETQLAVNQQNISNLTLPKTVSQEQKHITFTKKLSAMESTFLIAFGKEYKNEPSIFLMVDGDIADYSLELISTKKDAEFIYQSVKVTAWIKKGITLKNKDVKFDLYIAEQ